MKPEALIAIAVAGVLILILIGLVAKKAPRKLDRAYFEGHWKELLSKVKTPEGMILAIIDGDKLLDEALKRRHFKGKTMGERLVSAQRQLTDNDAVWFAHKLRNRLVHENGAKLRAKDAKKALSGIRQGLRDLGAL